MHSPKRQERSIGRDATHELTLRVKSILSGQLPETRCQYLTTNIYVTSAPYIRSQNIAWKGHLLGLSLCDVFVMLVSDLGGKLSTAHVLAVSRLDN